MIEHVVMWKFADNAEGKTREENMAIVRERLFALPAIIPEIKFMQIGRDVSRTDMSYDMMLLTEFESVEDMKTYAVHPEHLKVSGFIRSVIESRVVLDCDLDNA